MKTGRLTKTSRTATYPFNKCALVSAYNPNFFQPSLIKHPSDPQDRRLPPKEAKPKHEARALSRPDSGDPHEGGRFAELRINYAANISTLGGILPLTQMP